MDRMNFFSDSELTSVDLKSVKKDLINLYEFLNKCQNNTTDYSDDVINSLNNIIAHCTDELQKKKFIKFKDVISNRLATELILIDLNITELTSLEDFINSF